MNSFLPDASDGNTSLSAPTTPLSHDSVKEPAIAARPADQNPKVPVTPLSQQSTKLPIIILKLSDESTKPPAPTSKLSNESARHPAMLIKPSGESTKLPAIITQPTGEYAKIPGQAVQGSSADARQFPAQKSRKARWYLFLGLAILTAIVTFATPSLLQRQSSMPSGGQLVSSQKTSGTTNNPTILAQSTPSPAVLGTTGTGSGAGSGGSNGGGGTTVGGLTSTNCSGLLIPAYYGTGSLWTTSVAGAPAVSGMIVNVDSGPGAYRQQGFASAIIQAQNAGIRLFGYVDTAHGSYSIATVETQINEWKQFYGVVSIHLDDAYADPSSVSYYETITNYIHDNGGIDDLGIGNNPSTEDYIHAGDILNIFEGTYDDFQNWQPASWIKNYPASRFDVDIYGMPDPSVISGTLTSIYQKHAGYFMLTDSQNPWNELASTSFWQTEVADIESSCH